LTGNNLRSLGPLTPQLQHQNFQPNSKRSIALKASWIAFLGKIEAGQSGTATPHWSQITRGYALPLQSSSLRKPSVRLTISARLVEPRAGSARQVALPVLPQHGQWSASEKSNMAMALILPALIFRKKTIIGTLQPIMALRIRHCPQLRLLARLTWRNCLVSSLYKIAHCQLFIALPVG
jgi:hypothetical protein